MTTLTRAEIPGSAPPPTARADRTRRGSPARIIRGIPFHVTGVVLAFLFLFPLLWSALNSFKTSAEASVTAPRP